MALIPRISLEQLGRLSHNLAICLEAGVSLPRAWRTTTRSLTRRSSAEWELVAQQLEDGASLADALRAVKHLLPEFFPAMVDAGEKSGKLDEVLRHAARHCQLMARPAKAVRNFWLAPVAIYLAVFPLELLFLLISGNWRQLPQLVWGAIMQLGPIAAIALLLLAPPLKPVWDRLRLLLPVWGDVERVLNVSRFLRVFAVLYGAAATRVEGMIRFASLAVSNDYLCRDLRRAANAVEGGADLAEGFSTCASLNSEEQQMLAAGELSGTVEKAANRLADTLDDQLEARLKVINAVALRLTFLTVGMALIGTVARIATYVINRS